MEFDIKKASSNPLEAIQFEVLIEDDSTTKKANWVIYCYDQWRRIRIPYLLGDDYSGSNNFSARWTPGKYLNVGNKDKVLIGREAIYHADSPQEYGHLFIDKSNWNRGHIVLGTSHLWVDSNGKLRIKNGSPTSDTDGTVVGTQS